MKPLRLFRLGELGQWFGAIGTVGGAYVQIREWAPWIVWLVMGAAIIYAAATKIKYYARRKEDRRGGS